MNMAADFPSSTDPSGVSTLEASFKIDEVFYSRTDDRGVIRAGNAVFRRVSGFEWEELIGAPHKIVRHPDMPKAVFYLMWQELKVGNPIGTYVKNKTKDGRYYWVFAIANRASDGFISVRMKPTSALHEEIVAIYAKCRKAELSQDLSPEQSADLLLAEIQAIGYPDYLAFQARALTEELKSREAVLQTEPVSDVAQFRALSDDIIAVEKETHDMIDAFEALRTLPINMRILASRLENSGGAISAIAVNYGALAEEISNWMKTFIDGKDSPFARIRNSIYRGLLQSSVVGLQSEIIAFMRRTGPRPDCPINDADEREILKVYLDAQQEAIREALVEIGGQTGLLSSSVLEMKRHVMGLSSSRMLCKIENARLNLTGQSLGSIVSQLDQSQDGIEARLGRISELSNSIQFNALKLRE